MDGSTFGAAYALIKGSQKSVENVVPTTYTTNKQDVDLDITDAEGNVLARFSDGNIETKNFDSTYKEMNVIGSDARSGVDLDLCDLNGNVIMRLENGYIKTKKVDTTDPYELPSYYQEHITAKCNRIRELLIESGGDAFIFCTDQHYTGNSNTGHSPALIRSIVDKCKINKLFMGGDMADGVTKEEIEAVRLFRNAINGRMYMANGNHEYMRSGMTEELLAYIYGPDVDDAVAGDPLRAYYYVDNPRKQIRYIVLSGYKADNGTWAHGYESAQVTWLTTVAMNVPTGWHTIIISHVFFSVTTMSNPALIPDSYGEDVLEAIDASSYASSVMCIICGHTHVDGIKYTSGGIPIFITTCDKYKPYDPSSTGQEYWLENRVPGTIMEQAFDVFIIDVSHSRIYAVRIGAFNTGDAEEDATLFEAGERMVDLMNLPCTSISLNHSTLSLAQIGTTSQLTATVLPAYTTDTVSWSSSDERIATVSSTGLVTLTGAGTVTITATCGEQTATCVISATHTLSPTLLIGEAVVYKRYNTDVGGFNSIAQITFADYPNYACGYQTETVTGQGDKHIFDASGSHTAYPVYFGHANTLTISGISDQIRPTIVITDSHHGYEAGDLDDNAARYLMADPNWYAGEVPLGPRVINNVPDGADSVCLCFQKPNANMTAEDLANLVVTAS